MAKGLIMGEAKWAKPLPSYERLHKLFEERKPGVLFWRPGTGYGRPKRRPAGYYAVRKEKGRPKELRNYIKVGSETFRRSRIIWKMHKKVDPLGVIDHINKDSRDDRIENLRDVPEGPNQRNRGDNDGTMFAVVTGNIQRRVAFSLTLWPDEDSESIETEINALLTPIVKRIYSLREGRTRPRDIHYVRPRYSDTDLEHLLSDLE